MHPVGRAGKEGKSRIGVRAKYGVSQFANDNDYGVMTGQELLSYQRQAIINAGMNPDDPSGVYYRPMELLTRQQTNWMDHFTRLGKMQEYEINLSGGSQRTKYYSSISYHDNEGVFYGVDFQKMQAELAKVSVKVEADRRGKTKYVFADTEQGKKLIVNFCTKAKLERILQERLGYSEAKAIQMR